MKLFVVGLIHRDDIVLSFEYLDLQKHFSAYMYNCSQTIEMDFIYLFQLTNKRLVLTSSAS